MIQTTLQQRIFVFPLHLFLSISAMLLLASCVCTAPQNNRQVSCNFAKITQGVVPEKPQKEQSSDVVLKKIAVSKINIDHLGAGRVYKENSTRDKLVRHMLATGNYQIIDWKNLQENFLHKNLEKPALQNNKNNSVESDNDLPNDYFLMGSIASYGERVEYKQSAFSKGRTQIVNTTLELLMKDASSNEIVASAQGKGEGSRETCEFLGFGAASSTDTVLADEVLDCAIADAIGQLEAQPIRPLRRDSIEPLPHFPRGPKVLFIFAEKDATGAENPRQFKPEEITVSTPEHAMAKEFLKANCQVLTVDYVVNPNSYSISGGENLTQGGWLTEREIRNLEELLTAHRTGLAAYALQVGREAKVDIVISGTVQEQTQKVEGPGGMPAKLSTAILTAKAIVVESGKILHVTITERNYLALQNPSGLHARTNAMHKAAEGAAVEFLRAMQRENVGQ